MTAAARRGPDALCALIESYSGLIMDEVMTDKLEVRLRPLMREIGCSTLDDLATRLASSSRKWLWDRVIQEVAVGETFWFRDPPLWDLLEREVLPTLLHRAEKGAAPRVWCAGVSTGQEAYSVAILVDEVCRRLALTHAPAQLRILGTDISRTALLKARQRTYDLTGFWRGLDPDRRARYFHRDGQVWTLDERVARVVHFEQHNLLGSPAALGTFDVIIFRNVAIYFSAAVQRRVFDRLVSALRPGGLLLMGARERAPYPHPALVEARSGTISYFIKPARPLGGTSSRAQHGGIMALIDPDQKRLLFKTLHAAGAKRLEVRLGPLFEASSLLKGVGISPTFDSIGEYLTTIAAPELDAQKAWSAFGDALSALIALEGYLDAPMQATCPDAGPALAALVHALERLIEEHVGNPYTEVTPMCCCAKMS